MTKMTWLCSIAFFVALIRPLLAQNIAVRVEALDANGMYKEVLTLCLDEGADSPAALFLAAEYYNEGRTGIERDTKKGREYYLKALNAYRSAVEAGDLNPSDKYRFARCIEFGLGEVADAREWYVSAAEGGHTNAMRRVMAYWESEGGRGEIPESFENVPEIWTPDAKAKHGARLYEKEETREKGLAFLREAAQEGSPFAMARLSALYYLGEGGVEKDLGMALKLMKAAVAKGFPGDQLPIDQVQKEYDRLVGRTENPKSGKDVPSVLPGHGYPGKLEPYDETSELKARMERFGLTSGWFRRAPLPPSGEYRFNPKKCPANELPYLLFSPKRGRKPVPMVLYFGGTGEHGTNLVDQFKQTTVFEKVADPDFQKRHPCYIFAPMLPKGGAIRTGQPAGHASNLADLTSDAMYAVIATLNSPPVDMNRIYVTGLSWGGAAAFEMSCGYPGRFAACVPVSCIQSPGRIPKERPGNYWMLYNETSYQSEWSQSAIRDIEGRVKGGGGDFRQSTFPDTGHDAWSKAWREDGVWEWMFSKTADGKPVGSGTGPRPTSPKPAAGAFLEDVVCAASKPGMDDGHGPERAADGLDATCYVSGEPMGRGDWWMIEFAEPVKGRITVHSGTRSGEGRLSSGRVEVSRDGRLWSRAGGFSRRTGDCSFVQRSGIKFLRVLPEPAKPETLTLREITVAPQ